MTVDDLLTAELRRDGTRPFLTWYDDATGERIELSVTTLDNWAAKVANLLADEYGVDPGDPVVLDPPTHWLTVVAACGIWRAGAAVDLAGVHAVVVVPGEPGRFMAEVLPQPDALSLALLPDGDEPALLAAGRAWTGTELAAAAQAAAHQHQLPTGARVLSTLPLDSVDALDAGLLMPLAAGGSVVWVVNADPGRQADRARIERVTHTAGVDLEGLPRLDS